jgi:dihydropteroate synthase
MIGLAELAALHAAYAEDLQRPVEPVALGDDVVVGDGRVTLMGVVNLSPDSAYRESVAVSPEAAVRMGRTQASQGAAIIDLGAEASEEKADRVGPQEQIERLVPVVEELSRHTLVSVETYHAEVVEAVLAAGARLINLTGRQDEEAVVEHVARADAGLLMVFSPEENVRGCAELPTDDSLLPALVEHFTPRLERARAAGVTKVVVDPGSGFTYANLSGVDKARIQSRVLAQSMRLRELGVPCGHALPHAFELFEAEFRHAEGFFAVLALLGGAHLLRVHEMPRIAAVVRALAELEVG